MSSTYILGFGKYIPPKVLTNEELEKLINTSDEWIVTRTGIRSRHMVDPSMVTSDMACAAADQAIEHAGLQVDDITHIIVATCTPDTLIPNCACLVAQKIGLKTAMAFDINVACSGFIYALNIVNAFAVANPKAKILLIAAESLTRRVNWDDRSTCVLFGDGASAFVMGGAEHGHEKVYGSLLGSLCFADGTHAELLQLGCGNTKQHAVGDVLDESFFIQMEGREIYKTAVRSMVNVSKDLLSRHGMTVDDIDVFVPHQANLRIIEAVGQRLQVPVEKVFTNVEHMGNTSAASIPLAIIEANEKGILKSGNKILLATFAGGFTWGSALIEWH